MSIVAALINPAGPDKGLVSVTILNITPNPVDLSGWKLSDRNKNKMPLSDVLNAGQTLIVKLPKKGIELPNDGGIITLLDSKGLKVHRVSYTGKDASKEGWTIVF